MGGYICLAEVKRHTSSTAESVEDVMRDIEKALADGRPTQIRFVIEKPKSQQLVGTVGFRTISELHGTAEMSCDVTPSEWVRASPRLPAGPRPIEASKNAAGTGFKAQRFWPTLPLSVCWSAAGFSGKAFSKLQNGPRPLHKLLALLLHPWRASSLTESVRWGVYRPTADSSRSPENCREADTPDRAEPGARQVPPSGRQTRIARRRPTAFVFAAASRQPSPVEAPDARSGALTRSTLASSDFANCLAASCPAWAIMRSCSAVPIGIGPSPTRRDPAASLHAVRL